MILEEALVDMLKNDEKISNITERIYPVMIPQNPQYPLIVYQKITGYRDTVLSGPSGFAHPRIQIDSYAETYAEAKELANFVKDALYGKTYEGNGVRIASIIIISETDFFEPAIGCHRISMDFSIWHDE